MVNSARSVSWILALCLSALTPLASQSTPPGPKFDGTDVRDVGVEARAGRKPTLGLGARIAVVVGLDRYEHLSPLSHAEKDAKALEETGFAVTSPLANVGITPAHHHVADRTAAPRGDFSSHRPHCKLRSAS